MDGVVFSTRTRNVEKSLDFLHITIITRTCTVVSIKIHFRRTSACLDVEYSPGFF
jgi:hypothetical protein